MITFCTDHHIGRFQKLYGTVLCQVEGCFEKASQISGYCKNHYYRIRTGRKPREFRKCSVEGCGKKHWQHDYCRTHWARVQRFGSPHLRLKFSTFCCVEDCFEKVNSRGYCKKHLYRIKNGLSLDIKEKLTKGEHNRNWKGGVSEYPNHSELKRVRKQKIKDCGGKCLICGKVPKILQMHHIDFSKDNHAYDNLLPACPKCSKKFHLGQTRKTSKIIRLYGISLQKMVDKFGSNWSKYYEMHRKGILKEFLFYNDPNLIIPNQNYIEVQSPQ